MADVMQFASPSLDSAFELMAPMWVEISFTTFFVLGYIILRFETFSKRFASKAQLKHIGLQSQSLKSLEAYVSSGNNLEALKTWRATKAQTPTPVDTLRLVVQVLLEEEPQSMTKEISEHIAAHIAVLGNARTACAALDVVARSGKIALMEELSATLQSKLHISASVGSYEVLLGGYANVGDEQKVRDVISSMKIDGRKITARGYSLIIKGFLKNSLLDAALQQIQDMCKHGFFVPSFAVMQLFRGAAQSERVAELFETAFASEEQPQVPLSAEVVGVIMEDCLKRDDVSLARRLEKMARDAKLQLSIVAYDTFLKLLVVHADMYAVPVFERMRTENSRISEGLCVGLLARCAESKFLQFAEEIATYVRGRDSMSIAVYSALMKVYAYCGLYDKACDLYAQIRKEGLEPDAMMYGCLMKFAVECGRTELSQELFDKAPALDIQNYMSLIRAAGRDRDVDRAFEVLKKLKESGVSADIAAYNCVLDACVNSGNVQRGRALLDEMKSFHRLDVITYNTLLKGLCSVGDVKGARELFREMEADGHQPNDVSYNCLINTAASQGNLKEAWSIIEMMEKRGIAVDNYTVSIMMKSLKKVNDSRDVEKALSLLDRTGLDVCSDEVLLNTVLETCIRHKKVDRISNIILNFPRVGVRASVHTYGSMIKACSTLRQVDKCWELWNSMIEQRAMEPNEIVLGCMLDALVCNERVDDAVKVFRQWKTKVPPNTVMYSTLIKGFASGRRAGQALQFWEEMRQSNLPMNTVVYNALIDSQARVGATDAVLRLLAGMEKDGCKPDSITHSTIVKGYCIKGDVDKAFQVFRDMQLNSMASDCIVYNTMLDGCTRHNRMDVADMVLEDMDRNGIAASAFTLGILVKMYGKRHQLDKAFEVMREIPKKFGIAPNAQVSTCLMSACMNANELDRAFSVFNDLKKAGHVVDAKAFGVLISGCVRQGRLEEAVSLVDEACRLGSRANHSRVLETEPLEHLLRALAQRGQMETIGSALMDKLRIAGVPVSGRLVSSAVKAQEEANWKRSNWTNTRGHKSNQRK